MSTLRILPRRLNYGDPVNRTAPLNRGRTVWFLTLPQMRGASTWVDLVGSVGRKYRATRVPASGPPKWVGQSRPSGWGSFDFDASGTQYLTIDATTSLLESSTEITWAYWSTAGDTIERWPFCQFNNSGAAGWGTCYGNNGSGGIISVPWSGDLVNFGVTGTRVLTIDRWYRITSRLQVRGGNKYLSLWINGTLDVEAIRNDSDIVTTNNAKMGVRADLTHGYMWGQVDDCTGWNRALSDDEIRYDYVASSTGYQRELNWLSDGPVINSAAAVTTFIPLISDGELISPSSLIGRGLIHT